MEENLNLDQSEIEKEIEARVTEKMNDFWNVLINGIERSNYLKLNYAVHGNGFESRKYRDHAECYQIIADAFKKEVRLPNIEKTHERLFKKERDKLVSKLTNRFQDDWRGRHSDYTQNVRFIVRVVEDALNWSPEGDRIYDYNKKTR